MTCSRLYILVIAVTAAMLLSGCSTRKNTAANRNYQAFITRYNIYYNGDEHYKSTLEAMERDYADDYSRLLPLHPADARRDPMSPQPSGDFTRSIEKAQKAIELRSIKRRPARKPGRSNDPAYREWLKREEYNPFLHNAWMMLGRSQYASGDFTGAAATFRYIARHFSWLPETVTEAKLWQARCYSVLGWEFEAESLLQGITTDDLKSQQLEELYDIACATRFLASGNPEKAIPYIEKAVTKASRWQKHRLYYLLGQLYSRAGDISAAYNAFGKSTSSATTNRARINARVRQSEVYTSDDITREVKALKRMTRFDSNSDYRGLLYYAIGNLYKSRGDTAQAVTNYRLSLESQPEGNTDKGFTLLSLGDIYFKRKEYVKAQPCYAEAVALLPTAYPGYDSISRLSDILDRLAVYINNINHDDSTLNLADKPEEERTAIIKAYISQLKKRDKEQAEKARREEYFADRQNGDATASSTDGAAAPTSFSLNNDDSWYFYNNAVRNAGRTEFQRRWGARRLEDDWRRRDKSSSTLGVTSTDETDYNDDDVTQSDDERNVTSENPYDVEYYMKQLPLTAEARRRANDIIQDGLYNAALILKDDLHDYSSAARYWERLLSRYPENPYCIDAYYNMYMMYRRNGDMTQAERYRSLLLDRFPESRYATALHNPDGLERMRDMARREEELYGKAYSAYIGNRNEEVHEALRTMKRDYPLSNLMPKFMFIDALSYVTENDADRFKNTLKEIVDRYPDADVTPVASAYLAGLNPGRHILSGAENPRGIVWRQALTADSIAGSADTPAEFELNPDTPQLFILAYPVDEVEANQLLYNVARHNFSSFVIKDFDLECLNFGNIGLLIVKGFANFDELAHYRKVLDDDTSFTMPPKVTPVMISVDDFNALLRDGRSIDDYFKYVNERAADEPVTVPVPDNDENDNEQ